MAIHYSSSEILLI